MIKRSERCPRTHDFFDGHAASFREKRRVDANEEGHGSTAVAQKFAREHGDKDVLENKRFSGLCDVLRREERKTDLPREGEEGGVEGKDSIGDELEVGGGDDHTSFIEKTSKECDGVFHTEERKQLRKVSPPANETKQDETRRNEDDESETRTKGKGSRGERTERLRGCWQEGRSRRHQMDHLLHVSGL